MDNVMLFLVGQLITSAAIWGAIRADIKAMHQRMDDVKKVADEAHQRIDRHIEQQFRSQGVQP